MNKKPQHSLPPISASEPDWTRERPAGFWDPGRKLLKSIRDFQAASVSSSPFAGLARRSALVRHIFWSVVSGAEIPINTRIGGGLLAPHPNGIVIHPDSLIGPNCLIMQQVTLGVGADAIAPTLGGHVDIGAGAKIIGGVTIGDHARIGANAVVLSDVPAGATAVGVPARVVAADADAPLMASLPA